MRRIPTSIEQAPIRGLGSLPLSRPSPSVTAQNLDAAGKAPLLACVRQLEPLRALRSVRVAEGFDAIRPLSVTIKKERAGLMVTRQVLEHLAFGGADGYAAHARAAAKSSAPSKTFSVGSEVRAALWGLHRVDTLRGQREVCRAPAALLPSRCRDGMTVIVDLHACECVALAFDSRPVRERWGGGGLLFLRRQRPLRHRRQRGDE